MRTKYVNGLHAWRLKSNPEEKAFSEAWKKGNSDEQRLLSQILGDGANPVQPSDRDHEVVAIVIQWLGSPVGQRFLRDLGYAKVPAKI